MSLGIGDDAALLRLPKGHELATSVDAFVEGTHFRLGEEPPRSIGRRALAAALSDLAAVGAKPLGATLAAALPGDLPATTAKELARGVIFAGRSYGCPLVGGNLARAREVSLAISVFGAVRADRVLRRDAARVGDRIYLTGRLGIPALARLRRNAGESCRMPQPVPRLAAGQALGRSRGRGACIDLSDGLLADLRHVLDASGVGACLDWAALPKPPDLMRHCRRLQLEPESIVLAGGEDYELLFTGRGLGSCATLSRRLGVAISEVGEVTEGGLRWSDGVARKAAGWRHF